MKNVSKEMNRVFNKQKVSLMKYKFVNLCAVAALSALLCPPVASAVPVLGSDLASFAVLGASGVTNVATSTIGGNLGSAPNASVGGGYVFTSGSLQPNTTLAQNAQTQLDAAILAVNANAPFTTVIGSSLDAWQSSHGGVITPGTYTVSADPTANLMGNLFLDGLGSSTAVWNFLFTSTFVTSSTSNVTVQNVGSGANVGLYWSVASAATLNGPTFAGNVLAMDTISSDGDLTIACGRLLSATKQVTLIQDKISIAGCGNLSGGFDQGVDIGSGGTGGGTVPVVPEPGTVLLFGVGLAGLVAFRIKTKNA